MYDATVPEKTALDSAGKTLSILSSDKNKASPPDRQLELVEKSKGEIDHGNMVKFYLWKNMQNEAGIYKWHKMLDGTVTIPN